MYLHDLLGIPLDEGVLSRAAHKIKKSYRTVTGKRHKAIADKYDARAEKHDAAGDTAAHKERLAPYEAGSWKEGMAHRNRAHDARHNAAKYRRKGRERVEKTKSQAAAGATVAAYGTVGGVTVHHAVKEHKKQKAIQDKRRIARNAKRRAKRAETKKAGPKKVTLTPEARKNARNAKRRAQYAAHRKIAKSKK